VIADTLGRPLRNLRLSVTDRCNLRCEYCMPEDDYAWLPREDVLHFEEISTLVDRFVELGVDKVRLTGGEPLLRRDLPALIAMVAAKPGIRDLALTTNGLLLPEQADALKSAGLRRITISLDTLRRDRFARLTRVDALDKVLLGIDAARRVWGSCDGRPSAVKLDSVMIKGINDDELVDLIDFAKKADAEIRFIEYMDVGGASKWSPAAVLSRREMLERIAARFGEATSVPAVDAAPADRYALPDGTIFGIIASTTEPFCASCDRSRLTADGMWYRCLYAAAGTDRRGPLRAGASSDELKALIAGTWRRRADRGAETRLALGDRRAFVPVVDVLKRDPHLEMHTRGG